MEYTIKDHDYHMAKLSVFDQSEVTRKLLPVLAGMMSGFGNIRSLLPADGKIDSAKFDTFKPVFEALLLRIADVLPPLSEEDTSAVIHPCLSVVSHEHMDGWTPAFNSGQLMFDDINLLTVFQLVTRVVADSLGSFLPVGPTSATPDQSQG